MVPSDVPVHPFGTTNVTSRPSGDVQRYLPGAIAPLVGMVGGKLLDGAADGEGDARGEA